MAAVASAPLEIRGVRFTCTAPTRWPPLYSPPKPHSHPGHWYHGNGSLLACFRVGFKPMISYVGGRCTNQEAKWLQPLASVASAPLEIRGVRFTCTAPTRWPPLHMHMKENNDFGYATVDIKIQSQNINTVGPVSRVWYGKFLWCWSLMIIHWTWTLVWNMREIVYSVCDHQQCPMFWMWRHRTQPSCLSAQENRCRERSRQAQGLMLQITSKIWPRPFEMTLFSCWGECC